MLTPGGWGCCNNANGAYWRKFLPSRHALPYSAENVLLRAICVAWLREHADPWFMHSVPLLTSYLSWLSWGGLPQSCWTSCLLRTCLRQTSRDWTPNGQCSKASILPRRKASRHEHEPCDCLLQLCADCMGWVMYIHWPIGWLSFAEYTLSWSTGGCWVRISMASNIHDLYIAATYPATHLPSVFEQGIIRSDWLYGLQVAS